MGNLPVIRAVENQEEEDAEYLTLRLESLFNHDEMNELAAKLPSFLSNLNSDQNEPEDSSCDEDLISDMILKQRKLTAIFSDAKDLNFAVSDNMVRIYDFD